MKHFASYEAERNNLREARVECAHCMMFLSGNEAVEYGEGYFHLDCLRRNQNENKKNVARTIIRLVHSTEIISGSVPEQEAA